MNAFAPMLEPPLVRALGWALLHFIWQGTGVAVLMAVGVAMTRSSAAKYVIGCAALLFMLVLPAATTAIIYRSLDRDETSGARSLGSPTALAPDLAHSVTPERPALTGSSKGRWGSMPSEASGFASQLTNDLRYARLARALEPALPWLVSGWLLGVLALSLRLAGGWVCALRLKTRRTRPAADSVQQIVHRLAMRLRMATAIRLLESSAVHVPMVIGWVRPVILLPTSAIAGLAPHQLEAILAHELAHIRRHDFLANLLQTLVETLLFYHPAVWWVSARIRIEREHCCDDVAVAVCGDAVIYATALTELEEARGVRALALAATGGSLVERVRRLLGAPGHDPHRPTAWFAALLTLGAVFFVAAQGSGSRASAISLMQNATLSDEYPQELAASGASATSTARVDDLEDIIPARPAFPAARAARAADARAPEPDPDLRPPASSSPVVTVDGAPAAQSAQSTHSSTHVSDSDSTFTMNWSDNGYRINLKGKGQIIIADNDASIKSISPGGYLAMTDGTGSTTRSLEVQSDSAGRLSYRYFVGGGRLLRGTEKPFDPEGRAWLARFLPEVVRRTGIGAESRVKRFLAQQGPAGVLAEISKIPSDYVKRIYFTELFEHAQLDAATVQRALRQAGTEISSDYEIAELLIGMPDRFVQDEYARQAYVEATNSVQSDYEHRRVLSALLKRGSLSAAGAKGLLQSALAIDSDYEQAELLIEMMGVYAADEAVGPQLFAAVETISSNYERRRVLTAVVGNKAVKPDVLKAALTSGSKIGSDYEQVEFLLAVAKIHGLTEVNRAAFFQAVDTISSDYERRRALSSLVKPGVSKDVLIATLQSAATMKSDFELAELLLSIIRTSGVDASIRPAFLETSEALHSDYEHGRVMSALVRSERAK